MAWSIPIIAAVAGAGASFGLSKLNGGSARIHNRSRLSKEQQPLLQQAINAGLGRGNAGAFGQAAEYYRDNLSNNPADFNAFAAPQLRQYNEDIVPGLSEQFAGLGSGGLTSSGFRNAQIQGATDLSERLAALRAQLRQNSAQGLQNIGQVGLGDYSNNYVNQPQASAASTIAPALSESIVKAGNDYYQDQKQQQQQQQQQQLPPVNTVAHSGGTEKYLSPEQKALTPLGGFKQSASNPYASNQKAMASPIFRR